MKKPTFVIIALTGFLGIWGFDKAITSTKNSQQMTVTVQTMKEVLDAFNRHDLDAIMEYFSDECSFDFPRGPEPFGQRFVARQTREKVLRCDSKVFLMFIMVTTAIGFPLTGPRVYRNGRSPEQQQQELS